MRTMLKTLILMMMKTNFSDIDDSLTPSESSVWERKANWESWCRRDVSYSSNLFSHGNCCYEGDPQYKNFVLILPDDGDDEQAPALRFKSKCEDENFDHKRPLVIVRRMMKPLVKPLVSLMKITLMTMMKKPLLVCVTHSPICPHVSRS